MFVITNLAVAGLELVQEPAMDKEGGVEGVFVGVEVGVLVGAWHSFGYVV